MTEAVEAAGVVPSAQTAGTGFAVAGAMLRQAREEAGLHIGALAVGLKVPVNKLEALESGNLEPISGLVFVRALASSVCRTLKIDPVPILEQLPKAVTAHLHQKGELNEPFRGAGRGINFSGSERFVKPSLLAVGVLLFGAAMLMFLPDMGPLLASFQSNKVAAGDVFPLPTPATSELANLPTTAGEAAPAQVVAPLAPQVPAVRGAATAQPDVQPIGGAGSDVLSFKASASTWIEVTDAKGATVLRKTLAAGEVAQVGGALPLKAIVGRADVTEVAVRGQPLDLKAHSKDNVARFEVK